MLKRQSAKISYTIDEKEDILFKYFKYLIGLINKTNKSVNQIPLNSYERAYQKKRNIFDI